MRILCVFLFGALVAAPAAAHNLECQGKPVPAAIKRSCCGEGDVQQLQPDQVKGDDESGWQVLIAGAWRPVVNRNEGSIKALPSDDGCYWVYYRRRDSKSGYFFDTHGDGDFNFYCLQVPFTM